MSKVYWVKGTHSRRHSILIVVILGFLLQCPTAVLGLEVDEFHLFGVALSGTSFDITPYSGDTEAKGDPNSDGGIVVQFFNWRPFGTSKAEAEVIGTCRVRNVATSYTFSCEQGPGRLAGTLYVGEKVNARTLGRNRDAQQLLQAWDKKMDHGAPDVFYRGKQGCTDDVPKYLLFIWYGD